MRVIIFAYLITIIIGIALIYLLPFSAYVNLLLADIVMTLMIWGFSLAYKNSSIYDPYWSVIPLALILFYAIYRNNFTLGIILLLIAISLWAIRLTANWVYTFKGLRHQDWRYDKFKALPGWFWSNLFGIHLMPTLIVFGVMLCGFVMIDGYQFNAMTVLGFIVALVGISLELISDISLHIYKKENPSILCRKGIWNISRHPNYLGEIVFWFGIYFMMLHGNYDKWYLVFGPVALACLFIFISIPMMEKRIKEKEGFDLYKKEVGMLLPYKFKLTKTK